MSKQTILGSGGSIGNDLAKELTHYTKDIRLVSRNPKKINETDELFSCDLTDRDRVMEAVEGSDITYVTVGLEYKTRVWQEQWPRLLENVIAACKKHNSKLVFFDNNYMYDPSYLGHQTEETPINPSSKKGRVRAQLVEMIMNEVEKKELQALIARSADFYGPGIRNSVLIETVAKNLAKGKKANWLCSIDKKHSMTYTPDAGKATAILGNADKAYGQVWHLPTASNPPTGREWIEKIAEELDRKPGSMVASKFMIKLIGVFNPIMKEVYEMAYQWDRDYVFDSSKFENEFDFRPTPYSEGIKKIAESVKQ
jgi:nucleoside-diphosphate-sugar epimerase